MSFPEDFPGRLGLQQRVLPAYRAPFFSRLAQRCQGGFSLLAGRPRPGEGIRQAEGLTAGEWRPAHNLNLFAGRGYVCYQLNWRPWLQAWQPEALIVEASLRCLSVPGMTRWMHRRGRPVIGWGLGAPGANGRLRPLWTRFLRQFDAMIAYSRRGAEEYVACGVPPQRVFVAPNAVLPPPAWGLPTRAIAPRLLTVLFVGRLQARKRVDLLIRACARLPQKRRPRLWIVGEGEARAELEALAAEIYPQAHFWGALYGRALQPLWLQADLFVLPGTGGLAMQEAMGYGLPVIAARGDGTQNDLISPQTGWLVPPDDLDALAAALETALSDVPRLRAMGAAAYRQVATAINLEEMTRAFLRALQVVTT